LALGPDPDLNLDPWVPGLNPKRANFFIFLVGTGSYVYFCYFLYFLDFVFMNLIYYSYFYTIVVGLILFTNAVLKLSSRYQFGSRFMLGPEVYFAFRSGFRSLV
jgi:hypothetical protein